MLPELLTVAPVPLAMNTPARCPVIVPPDALVTLPPPDRLMAAKPLVPPLIWPELLTAPAPDPVMTYTASVDPVITPPD